jgi:hypothetical protein
MKKMLLFPVLFAAVFALQAQGNISLHLSQRLGDADFALNTPVSAGTYEYKITRMEYYISDIRITHDGGQETPATDVYLLVRPAEDSVYSLGTYPGITNVEGITFSVGVDEDRNHADPSLYPAGHPLAPQNPSMHWGWSSGYRFAALEGKAGANFANDFEIHALGDANYKQQSIATTAETNDADEKIIHLVADYTQLFVNVDVSAGLIVHGSSGKAVTLLNNMKNLVFKADQSSGTKNPEFEGRFAPLANPMPAAQAMLSVQLPEGHTYRVTLSDAAGRRLSDFPVAATDQTLPLEGTFDAGVYFAQLWQNGRPVATTQLLLTR